MINFISVGKWKLNIFSVPCILRADATTTLQRLIDSNLEDYLSKFESVSEAASKEHVFERNLEKMKVRRMCWLIGEMYGLFFCFVGFCSIIFFFSLFCYDSG